LAWKEDWDTVYSDELRDMTLSPQSDLVHLSSHLKETFSGKNIYPDYSDALARVSRYFLRDNNQTKAFDLLNLCVALYPDTPGPLTHLGEGYIWAGDLDRAVKLYKRAKDLDPDHADLRLMHFYDLGVTLNNAGKNVRILTALGVAEVFYPKNAKLLMDLGDLYVQVGDREKAIAYYRKALKIAPKLKTAREKLNQLQRR
jgi:tetratricopeptide (TPR) repeat protein